MPGAYTSASMPPSAVAASAIAARHDASSVTSHVDRDGVRTGLAGRGFESLAASGEQRHVRAPLGQADPDAAPKPARRADDDSSHVVPPCGG